MAGAQGRRGDSEAGQVLLLLRGFQFTYLVGSWEYRSGVQRKSPTPYDVWGHQCNGCHESVGNGRGHSGKVESKRTRGLTEDRGNSFMDHSRAPGP